MKKKNVAKKPTVEYEVRGRYEADFEGTVEASNQEEAKKKIFELIDNAVGRVVIPCGSVDDLELDDCEAQMEDICVLCGRNARSLPDKDCKVLSYGPSLEFDDNVKMGVPKPRGNYACRKCLDPSRKLKGKAKKVRDELAERFPWPSQE